MEQKLRNLEDSEKSRSIHWQVAFLHTHSFSGWILTVACGCDVETLDLFVTSQVFIFHTTYSTLCKTYVWINAPTELA